MLTEHFIFCAATKMRLMILKQQNYPNVSCYDYRYFNLLPNRNYYQYVAL